MSLLHVYALLHEDDEPQDLGTGLGGARPRVVRAGGLAAVVSALEAPPGLELAALRAHDAVVRRAFATTRALLPMRFGQLVPDGRTLAVLVERALPRLRAALGEVEGCEQTTWRVFGDAPLEPAADEADQRTADRPGPHPQDPSATAGPGTRYLALCRERRRASAPPPRALAPVLERVAPLVRGEELESHPDPPLMATVHHLVRACDRDRYRRLLEDVLAEADGLRVRISDPAPPYAFAGAWRA